MHVAMLALRECCRLGIVVFGANVDVIAGAATMPLRGICCCFCCLLRIQTLYASCLVYQKSLAPNSFRWASFFRKRRILRHTTHYAVAIYTFAQKYPIASVSIPTQCSHSANWNSTIVHNGKKLKRQNHFECSIVCHACSHVCIHVRIYWLVGKSRCTYRHWQIEKVFVTKYHIALSIHSSQKDIVFFILFFCPFIRSVNGWWLMMCVLEREFGRVLCN